MSRIVLRSTLTSVPHTTDGPIRRVLRIFFQLMFMTSLAMTLSVITGRCKILNFVEKLDNTAIDELYSRSCPSSFQLVIPIEGPFQFNQPTPYIYPQKANHELGECVIAIFKNTKEDMQFRRQIKGYRSCIVTVILNERVMWFQNYEDFKVSIPPFQELGLEEDFDKLMDIEIDCDFLDVLFKEYIRPLFRSRTARLTVAGCIVSVTSIFQALRSLFQVGFVAFTSSILVTAVMGIPSIPILDWMQLFLYTGMCIPDLFSSEAWLYKQFLAFRVLSSMQFGRFPEKLSSLLQPCLVCALIWLHTFEFQYKDVSLLTLNGTAASFVILLELRSTMEMIELQDNLIPDGFQEQLHEERNE
eukprot:gene10565-2689_t